MTKRYRGELKKWLTGKGYGFIELREFEQDIFVHQSAMPKGHPPVEKQKIEFSIQYRETDGKPQAHDIKVLSTPAQLFNPDDQRPNPYSFVPVRLGDDASAPVFPVPGHDGAIHADRHSGELRITLKTLTPLLVAQRQHAVAFEDDHPLRAEKKDKKRTLLESWRLSDEQGRVVIPGSSLKGMLRHHLAALLNAPMERVTEQEYTYRPNLDHPKSGTPRCEFREAIVIEPPDHKYTGMQVKLLNAGRQAIFVRGDALKIIQKRFPGHVPKGAKFSDIEFLSAMSKRRLVRKSQAKNPWAASTDYTLVPYSGGLAGIVSESGESPITKKHDRGKKESGTPAPETKLYSYVLIPDSQLKSDQLVGIPAEIVAQYYRTLKSLADTEIGHSSSRNPNLQSEDDRSEVSKSFDKALAGRCIREGNMIYVERSVDGAIQSIGHNFRYRWIYKDSTTRLNVCRGDGEVRPECSVTEKERKWARSFETERTEQTPESESEGLTAARAIFGYVAEKPTFGSEFKGDISRLAGRISINHAVEFVEKSKDGSKKRFLKDGGIVPLRELGSPKASAVEFYLKQRKEDLESGKLTSYGDLSSETDSELSGRKFYRHQPEAYDDLSDELAGESESGSHLAPLARYISSPDTQFRFALRFQDLSNEELGALLFILTIDRATEYAQHDRRIKQFRSAARQGSDPRLGLKLGYARPLGLGSIAMKIDEVTTIGFKKPAPDIELDHRSLTEPADVEEWVNGRIKAFLKRGEELAPNMRECLDIWQWSGRAVAGYPSVEGEIYQFHTELRRHHSRARRNDGAGANPSPVLDRVKPGFNGQSGD